MAENIFKDSFKINDKQKIIMTKKGEYVKFKNYEREIKSPIMMYTDFESILVSVDNWEKIRKGLYEQISKTCFLQLWL